MDAVLKKQLQDEMERGGQAYIRNLVAAERATLRGQFNVAKILRASAHSQRVMAMEAGRLLGNQPGEGILLTTILDEIDTEKDLQAANATDAQTRVHLEQSAKVREGLRDIIKRSLASLENNSDVLENDVAQFVWGCYGCGALVEGDLPKNCPVCGMPGVEFEWYGPFYSSTPEHLGQLLPREIIEILTDIPDAVEAIITKVSDAVLQRKPSADEWCAAEIVGHMLETDMLFASRVVFLLEVQHAELPAPNVPWKLHEGKGYENMSAAELVALMRKVRTQTLDLIRPLTSEDWSLQGLIVGSAVSVLDLGTWLANHDRGHLEQVLRLCTN